MKRKLAKLLNSDDWEVLKKAVTEAVRVRINSLKQTNRNLRGFALLPGGPYEVDGLYSVSCNNSENGTGFNLSPDEWTDWHPEFEEPKNLIASLNNDFKSIHKKVSEKYLMDESETSFTAKFHNTFLEALLAIKEEGILEGLFVVIWLSDYGLDGIVKDSARKLNTEEDYKTLEIALEGFSE